MANMDFSKLQCQDSAVLRKVKELPGAGVLYEEPGILEIETANGVPHEQIRAISGEFPQSSITCEYSYEAEWYSQIDVVEYLAGESRFIDVKRHYMYIGDLPPELADIKDSTLRQIEDFFAKVDVVGEYGDDGLVLFARVWAKRTDYWSMRFAFLEAVKVAFDEAGIEIPYRQIDIHLKKDDSQ